MKKLLSLVLSLLMAISVGSFFTGCGNRPSSDTLRLVAHTEQEKSLEPFLNEFRKDNPDIKVEVLYGVDQLSALGDEYPPDLIMVTSPQIEIYKNYLLDLTTVIGNNVIADFLPNTLNMLKEGDRLLGLPMHANISLLYFNKKIFNANADALRTALGLSASESVYPDNSWTHEDFATAGKVLTKYDSSGNPEQWGSSSIADWWGEWLTFVRQYGGEYMNDAGDILFDQPQYSEGFKKGMEFYKAKIYDDGSKKSFSFNPTVKKVGYSNLNGFGGRKTAMIFGGHTGNWMTYNDLANFDWDVTTLPTPVADTDARGAELAVEGYGINKNSVNKEKAAVLLEYMYSAKGQTMFSQMNKLVPTNTFKNQVLAVDKADRPSPQNMEDVFLAMETGVALPRHPGFEKGASSVIQGKLDAYLKNDISTDAFMEAIKVDLNNYLNTIK